MRTRHRRLTSAPALLISAAVATAMLGACGGSSPEQEAIDEASAQLHGLGISRSTPLPVLKTRREQFQQIVDRLKPIAGSDRPAQAAAANALLARAQGAVAEIPAQEAAEGERQALSQISAIRAALDAWLQQKVIADALGSYDPSKELASIDDEIRQREAEAERVRQERQTHASRVESIRRQAADARAQVDTIRAQEQAIYDRVSSASETARAAAFEEALVVKRQGDQLEVQAAQLDAEAASLEPELAVIDATIEKLNRQAELLRSAKQALVARADANRAQAQAVQAEAQAGAAEVTRMLGELDQTRQALAGPTEQAASLYAAAAAAAKKAGGAQGASPQVANTLAASHQQSLADVLATKARGLGAYASLLEALNAGGQPGVTAEQVRAARDAYTQAVRAATEAYQTAIDMYAAGGRGANQERIDNLVKAMRALAGEQPAADEQTPADDQPPPVEPADDPAHGGDEAPGDESSGSGADGAGGDGG